MMKLATILLLSAFSSYAEPAKDDGTATFPDEVQHLLKQPEAEQRKDLQKMSRDDLVETEKLVKDTLDKVNKSDEEIEALRQGKLHIEQQMDHLRASINNDQESAMSITLILSEEQRKFETTKNLHSLSAQSEELEDRIQKKRKKLDEYQKQLDQNQKSVDQINNRKQQTEKLTKLSALVEEIKKGKG